MAELDIPDTIVCAICLCPLSEGNEGVVVTRCRHLFHKTCLAHGLASTTDYRFVSDLRFSADGELLVETLRGPCPNCKHVVFMRQCTQVYLNLNDYHRVTVRQYVSTLEKNLESTQKELLQTRISLQAMMDEKEQQRAGCGRGRDQKSKRPAETGSKVDEMKKPGPSGKSAANSGSTPTATAAAASKTSANQRSKLNANNRRASTHPMVLRSSRASITGYRT